LVTWAARHRGGRNAKYAGRRAANSQAIRFLARAGLVARGVMYVLIGWIAVQIAFGHSRQQADRTGALHSVAATPVGGIVLWLLVAGFVGMALWRLSEAVYGAPGRARKKASARWSSFARAVVYGVIAYGVLKFAIGAGAPPSSDKQSVDLTSTAMKYPGGKFGVIIIGVVLVGAGVYLAYQAWRQEFLTGMQLAGVRARTRRIVTWLGEAGGIARGAVFGAVGVFGVIAAVQARPQQAKGVDSALRALATTPLGPWLLVLVAVGLIMFGAFSCCEAKWLKL
jgi:hypothetical protein